MGSYLLSLPNELVQIVADNLGPQSDINNLARTSRHLYDSLNMYLYRHNVRHYNSSALLWAAWKARQATIEKSLAAGANIEAKEKQITPLFCAVSRGYLSIVRLLLSHGADPNSKNRDDETPLMEAMRQEDAIISLLLAHDGVNVKSQDKEGHTALHHAAWDYNDSAMRLLLKQDEVVDLLKPGVTATPVLHRAAVRNNEDIVKLLLEYDCVDPNEKDEKGRTVLHYAINSGDDEASEDETAEERATLKHLLTKGGADPNITDKFGRTALAQAAHFHNKAAVEVLLAQSGVRPDTRDRAGRTPLWYAVDNASQATVELLLAREGVDPTIEDANGESPLQIATRRGYTAILEILKLHMERQ